MNTKLMDEEEIRFLRRLQEASPSALIAGGAVRDMVFKKPYSNVDFFRFSGDNSGIPYAKWYDVIIPDIFELTSKDKYTLPQRNNIHWFEGYIPGTYSVAQIEKSDGRIYRIISTDKHSNLMNYIKQTFDLNCVMAWHNGKELQSMGPFKEFERKNVLNFNKRIEPNDSTMGRVLKIKERYPDVTYGKELDEWLKSPKDEKSKKKSDINKRYKDWVNLYQEPAYDPPPLQWQNQTLTNAQIAAEEQAFQQAMNNNQVMAQMGQNAANTIAGLGAQTTGLHFPAPPNTWQAFTPTLTLDDLVPLTITTEDENNT